jgi:hypothetical protein
MEASLEQKINTRSEDTSFLVESLKALSVQFALLMAEEGLQLKPFTGEALQHVNSLDAAKIKGIIENFIKYYEICQKFRKQQLNLRNNNEFVKYALKLMELKAPEVFFDHVAADDIVEIYNTQGIQVFRNIRFFEVTSYSLADLLVFEWYNLYDRPKVVIEKIFERVDTILKNEHELLPMDIPTHLLKEIKAQPIQVSDVTFKNISPLFSYSGEKAGFILHCQANSLRDYVNEDSLSFI